MEYFSLPVYKVLIRNPLFILSGNEEVNACLEVDEQNKEEDQLKYFKHSFTGTSYINLLN